MVNITATTGRENFQNSGSATLGLFVVPTRGTSYLTEKHIGLASRDPAYPVRTNGRPSVVSAGNNMKSSIVGEWTTVAFDIEEGTLLKVTGARNSNQFGTMRCTANILIRIRATAAYRRISMATTGNVRSTMSAVAIEGRFDIIPLADGLAIGAPVPSGFRPFYDDTFVRRLYTIAEIEPELITAAVVEDRQVVVDGEVRNVQIARRRRALTL
jgi:hypothetical protein